MTDYTRWSEDRTVNAWNRNEEPYGRDSNEGVYGGRDRQAGGQSGGPGYGYNQNDRYGGGDGPRRDYSRFGGRSSGRFGGYGQDAYGIPSDYGYQGPEIEQRNAQGGYDNAQRAYGEERYRQERYGYGRGAYGQGYSGHGYGASSNQSYGDQYRAAGAEHYPIDSRRAPEDRSFWNQARDEVAAWFGDEHATRRRQSDDLYFGEHRGKGPKGYTRSDERIHDDVNDRLTDHGHLDASDIEIGVSGAEVTLNGTVLRREDKRRAEDIAEQVSGVKHVQNNLRVKDAAVSAKSGTYGGATVGSTANQTSGVGASKAN